MSLWVRHKCRCSAPRLATVASIFDAKRSRGLNPHRDLGVEFSAGMTDQRTERKNPNFLLWVATTWISRRKVENGLVWFAGFDGPLHAIIDVENHALSSVLTVCRLVVAADNVERIHDVIHILAADAIEVEKGRVQFAAKPEAPYRHSTGKVGRSHSNRTARWTHIPSRIAQFQYSRQ